MDALKRLTKEERKKAYNEVFREAFPPAELKPLSAIERMTAAGEYEVLGLIRDGVPVGFAANWMHENYVLIDYLCVPRQIRCGGIGGTMIAMLRQYYPENTVFIVETEAETGDPRRDELILRRQAFYQRTGARFLPYECALFGVHYRTVVWANGVVDDDEVLRRHDGFYRRNFSETLYREAVQLPLKPGEPIFPMKNWKERPEQDTEECEENAQ